MTKLFIWVNSNKVIPVSYIGVIAPDGVRREVSDHSSPEDYKDLVYRSAWCFDFYAIRECSDARKSRLVPRPYSCVYYFERLDEFYVFPLSFGKAFNKWRIKKCAENTDATCPVEKDALSVAAE